MFLICIVTINCGKQEIDNIKETDYKLLQNRDGIYYLPNEVIPFNGKATDFYKNGQTKFIGIFKDGKLQGEPIRYYENGQLDSNRVVDYDLLQDRNGILYKLNEKKPYTGAAISYNLKNGQVVDKANFKDGKAYGEQIRYYENGQIMAKVNYKNGKLHGTWITYDKNGQVVFDYNYIDGIKQ